MLKGITLIRGIAAFFIVGCHINLAERTPGGSAVTHFCDMNVGLFAALSGFLMWKGAKAEDWMPYARKRCERLLPPYAVWTVVYLIVGIVFDLLIRHAVSPDRLDWNRLPWVILFGGASCHLWFVICLFYAQIVFASLCWIIKGWMAIILSCIGVLAIFLFPESWYAKYPLRLLAFLIGGYGLRSFLGSRIAQSARKSLFVFGFVLLLAVAHVKLSSIMPGFVRDWLIVFPIIVGFVYMPIVNARISMIVEWLGATSMGVFLVHPIITAGMHIVADRIFVKPFGVFPVALDWTVCWMIAIVVATIALKTPYIRKFWK